MANRQWNSSLKSYSLERTLAYYCHIIMGQLMNIGKALYKIAPSATDVLTCFGENLSFSQFHLRYNNYDRAVINTVPYDVVHRWYTAHRTLTRELRRPENEFSLCSTMDCSPPGSSFHEILQPRTLEWVSMPSSRGPC